MRNEECSKSRFSDAFPMWARTMGASCSAAILFTKKGALHISQLASTIFWGINNMYLAMVNAGLLEAYTIIPHTFFQNCFWGSEMQGSQQISGRKEGNRVLTGMTHRPFPML